MVCEQHDNLINMIEKIYSKIDKIEDKIYIGNEKIYDEINKSNIKANSLLQHQSDILADMRIVKRDLNGNGKEGYLTKIDRHEMILTRQAGSLSVIYGVLVLLLIPMALMVFRIYWSKGV